MTNPFDQFDGTGGSGNAFDQFDASVPVEHDEQEVIHKTNNPLAETPSSFGLTEIPAELAKGFLQPVLSSPQIVGGSLAEAGELSQGMKGMSTIEAIKASLNKKSMFDTIPLLALAETERDALLSLFSDGEAPKVMINAGNALVEQNQAAITSLGLTPKGGTNVAYDIGNAFGQVAITIGTTFATKNPEFAAAYMGALINSQDYAEARKVGKTPEEAATVAAASAYGQGLIELAGGRVFLAASKASSFLTKVLIRSTGQAAEEAGQGVVEEAVKGATGVRNTPMSEKLSNIGYQAMLGFIAGAPISTVVTKIEDAGRKEGLPEAQVKDIAENLVKNKDEIIDAATVLIDKETAGVTNDDPARSDTQVAVRQVFTDHAEMEKVKADGSTDDPAMVAKILLSDPDVHEQTKASIRELGTTPSMDDLHAIIERAPVKQAAEMKTEIERLTGEKPPLDTSGISKMQAGLARWRELTDGFRKGTSLSKAHVKEAQGLLVKLINESDLELNDKGKFLSTVKNIQTAKQLVAHLPEIDKRIASLEEAADRRSSIKDIKDIVARAKGSNSIAVDFAKQIEGMVDEIDTKNRQPKTIESLQKTLDYLKQNPNAELPKGVLNKLDILNKKRLEDITTKELRAFRDQLEALEAQGRTKLALLERKKEREKQERLETLKKTSVPLSDRPVKRAMIGERLSIMESIKNKYLNARNRLSRLGLATNPMDVFFDMLDGNKSYKGSNYKIFKRTADVGFSRYLNLKEAATREVKNLSDKLDLHDGNFEKIGAYAVLQQEGGKKKLIDSGITQEEIDGLSLNKGEMQMYQLMRKKLDEMLPAIQDVMRHVYNKEVDGVKDYFPFMTDHEAMKDFEIQDQIGEAVPQIGKKKNVEKGFTEKRTGGKQKIRIDALGVFLRHIDNAAYLVEMGGDIKSLGDVAGSKEYGEMVGDVGQEMVTEWINLLARKGNVPGRINAIDALRRNVGFAVLGYKLSSILIQPTSLMDGAALLGGSYVAEGAFKVGTSSEWRQFLWDNVPEIRERAGDDPAYLDMGEKGIAANVRQAGFWALKKIDSLAASAVAVGAYTKSVEQRGGEVDLSNPDPVAIQDAQLALRRTQSSGFAKDAPPLITQGELTGNPSLDKLIFQFQSFMLNRWSLVKHDMYEIGIKQGETKQALNIATWLLLATAAEVGIRRLSKDLITAITGGKIEPWEKTIGKEAVMTLLGNIPFVSQAVGSFEYGSVPVPAIAIAAQITNEMKLAAQSKSTDKKIKHLTSAAMIGVGVAAGFSGTIQAESVISKAIDKKKGTAKNYTP